MNQSLLDKAKIAFVQERYEEAIAAFSEILEENPGFTMAYYSRGTARMKMKDLDGAIEDYSQYIRENDRNEKVFCSRGTAYLGLKRYDEAMEDFNQSIELCGHYPHPYFGRSEIFARMGDKDQARQDWEAGSKLQAQRLQSHLETQGIMFQDPSV